MPHEKTSTTTFTYYDPSRCFDGTPYEAAGQAAAQALEVIALALRATQDTAIQARNSWMQSNIDRGGDPDGSEWEDSPQARVIERVVASLDEAGRLLRATQRSASYDPKNPPKE